MMLDINSTEKQKIQVRLIHRERGELGVGVLHFGGNQFPQVVIDIFSKNQFVSGEKIDLVEAVSERGTIYTLCSSKVHGYILLAEFLVDSKIMRPEFEQIVVRYSEVSEWLLRLRKIEGLLGEQLTWKNTPKPLSIAVSTPEDKFELRSENVVSKEQIGEDLIIHEHIEFVFTSTESKFTIEDVKAKTLELSCLLSILMGCPAGIVSVKGIANDNAPTPIYFPSFTIPEQKTFYKNNPARWFVQAAKIEEKWQTIVTNYYVSNYRKVCWVRLAAMQRYEGFWEYSALGYISLLDKFVSIKSDLKEQPKPESSVNEKLTEFRRRVDKKLPHLNEKDADTIQTIAGEFLKRSQHKSFAAKFQEAIRDTDLDIQKVIAISEKDFQFIKKVRDAIAHGDDPGLTDGDFSKVNIIVAKTALLLTYWAFVDFGLSKEGFIDCLCTTQSQLKLTCSLDEVALDRASGKASFFSVTDSNFKDLLKIPTRHLVCFARAPNGDLCFSERYTKMYWDWMNNPSRRVAYPKPKEVFDVDDEKAKYYGSSYLEFMDERIKIHGMWIFDFN